jgi:pimeloyl-ACP methyl ester carboxylesterase
MRTMKPTKRRHRDERSRLRGMVLVGAAAGLSAIVVGMRRRSRRTAPTQPAPLSETEMREQLLKDLPVTERKLDLAGVSTSLLEGGEGPPLVLLHGQGNFAAAAWMSVIPELVRTYHVIAPDLPGLGASEVPEGPPGADTVLAWLSELIDKTCVTPPAVVGISLGGQVATRFAAEHSERFAQLVLVDTPGLGGRARPAPGALLALIRHSARPSERSSLRLFRYATLDPERVRQQTGERWEPFLAYMLDRARTPSVRKANRRLMREFLLRQMPREELSRINVPTTLIWGRHDRIAPLRAAEEASAHYGWPLQVIEDAGHLPPREQPEAFVRALRAALGTS